MSVRGWAIIDGVRLIPSQVRDMRPLPDHEVFMERLRFEVTKEIEALRKDPDVYDLLWAKPRLVALDTIKL